ncbi:MAG TPA: PAS domain-containing sensor histidine kinase [Flexivirga sp.]|uniref:sensor histidine kinase n=1 Tax=Flexivirga sp. TaxID=1962927 RepID=UPI002B7BF79E|nr:PAS domain-containing sensor histidine kinase [Flexivirga sp.]HWC23922.1 PAS domain-containing sensor histidine kinase [Flexivirga sp.]
MSDQSRQPVEPPLAPGVYAALLEQLPEGVVVVDAGRRLVLANHRAERLTGIHLTDRVGQDICEALPLLNADGRSYWETDNPWGGLRTRSGSPEQRLVLADGRSVLAATRHIRAGSDRTLQWLVMTMRSTTVRDRIESETSALVTTIAHELRAPLGAVRGFSRTLRNRWDQLRDDQKLWMLDAIDTDAARLQRQVGELLDISRLDTGRLMLRSREVDLLSLVRTGIERVVSTGVDADRFRVVSQFDEVRLTADADRLTQVLSNLLENAVRHGRGTVTVTVQLSRREVQLDVSDEGPGIAPEHRSLVFTRFWQARGRGGNGLGLYVVHGLVAAHGGRVEVLDLPGGATFRMTLPRHTPEPEEAAS